MAKANVNVVDESEIGEEEMAVFLLNQAFDKGVLDKRDLLYCYLEKITISGFVRLFFRIFVKLQVYRNGYRVFGFADTIKTVNCHVVSSVEALCIVFKSLAYPCRYCYMIQGFRRSASDLPLIFNQILNLFDASFSHLFSLLYQAWPFS